MLQKLREKMKSTQRGAIMVFFALLVPLFLGMIGFAVDAGFLYMQKAKLQDIADAAALAGAGHLNDGDNIRGNNVTQAVKAFGGANGMADKATSSSYVYLNSQEKENDEAVKDQLNDKNPWRIAQAIDTQMTDKDGKNRDHVRVIIWKRVPTFFIRFLFPNDEKYEYVVVKAMAAAEYVEGEAPVADYSGPKIICSQFNYNYVYNSDTIKVKEGEDFTIWGGAEQFDYNKLPKVSNSVLFSPHGATVPEGWTLIRTSKSETDWNLKDPIEKAQYEALKEAKNLCEEKKVNYYNKMEQYIADRESYVRGDSYELNGKRIYKRYIGFDENWKTKNNINGNEGIIDLYMDTSDVDSMNNNGYDIFLTDRQLKGVKNVNTLIFGRKYSNGTWGDRVIATNGVTYGNIYNSVPVFLSISGNNNHFNGLIYNFDAKLMIGGYNNYYNETGQTEIFCNRTWGQIILGSWLKITENIQGNGSSQLILGNETNAVDSSWNMYWGGNGTGSGSSSGSSSSDTATKSRVRLVI